MEPTASDAVAWVVVNVLGNMMAGDLRRAALLELVSNSATVRAARYREQAAQLREMAEAESLVRLRSRLIDLAEQYEGLASVAELNRREVV